MAREGGGFLDGVVGPDEVYSGVGLDRTLGTLDDIDGRRAGVAALGAGLDVGIVALVGVRGLAGDLVNSAEGLVAVDSFFESKVA